LHTSSAKRDWQSEKSEQMLLFVKKYEPQYFTDSHNILGVALTGP
jgi:hypothetical protein